MSDNNEQKSTSRIDSDSIFYNRIVPVLLAGMGVLMAVLILLALGVLVGLVPFR
jgi:hypothetical protein